MSELKLYRVVTLKIECDNWSSASGEWVNSEYYEYLSVRQVLGEDDKEWQVVDCGTLETNEKALNFIYDFDDKELLSCIVNEKVCPKYIVHSGYFEPINYDELTEERLIFEI